ncbi:MAG TPA: adenylate/guanylate cyclase domain-containing protein [Afifellaceae bacterium]|nr:adenylate/guanylate cyclase domain-containing protein [Afifellaceae bacterium]
MPDETLVGGIGDWLVDQALSQPDIVAMFEGVCHKLYAIGVPIARARLTWPTLHPLFQAETVVWRRNQGTEFEQFIHQDQVSEAWLNSPMKYMFDNDVSIMRRHLDGPDKLVDFEILEELIEQGLTDYLAITTPFGDLSHKNDNRMRGIIVTWASDRPGGFTDDDIAALKRIQRRYAVACKTAIQDRIARNITETYLGKQAGHRVLSGQIRRGDGQATKAVVWYSDLRNSTALADTMPSEDFIRMLNVYFECTAGPAIAEGGEILDFIGDAVLAIFPCEEEGDLPNAVAAATRALQVSLLKAEKVNRDREAQGLIPIRFGVGLNTGTVMFGNIGVPERLSFSVIGPTVNEVNRIETMTKALGHPALATASIAGHQPDCWQSVGKHHLAGVSQPMELFAASFEKVGSDVAQIPDAGAGEAVSGATQRLVGNPTRQH